MKSACTEYSILPCEEKDAEELAALEALCFSLPWSVEQYKVVLRAADLGHETLNTGNPWELFGPVAVLGMRGVDKSIAAYLSLGLYHAAGELEVYNIAVRPDLRGKGLGHSLLAFALRKASLAGYCRAVLEVRPSNAPALALYERLGFTLCGRRKGYYADTGEDALVLESVLTKEKDT